MKKYQNIKTVQEFIEKEIVQSSKKLVIAIDGYSGAGKTTLLKSIAEKNKDIFPVFMDDFILPIKERELLISKAEDKSKVFELQWYDYQKIKDLISDFKNNKKDHKKVLIIEGTFLFHPKLFKNVFDVKIYLDVDFKKANKKRVEREKKRWGKDYFPEDHPDSFTRLFKIAYRRYCKEHKPEKQADFVVKCD